MTEWSGSGYLDPNVWTLYFYSKTRLRKFGAQAMTPIRNVELPAMPGAGDNRTVQFPVAERSAGMGAHAIQRTKLAPHIVDGHDPASGHELLARTFWNLIDRSDSQPLRHRLNAPFLPQEGMYRE